MGNISNVKVAAKGLYECKVPQIVESTDQAKAERHGDVHGVYTLTRFNTAADKTVTMKRLRELK
jgi:hypothetical protein